MQTAPHALANRSHVCSDAALDWLAAKALAAFIHSMTHTHKNACMNERNNRLAMMWARLADLRCCVDYA